MVMTPHHSLLVSGTIGALLPFCAAAAAHAQSLPSTCFDPSRRIAFTLENGKATRMTLTQRGQTFVGAGK